MAITAPKKPVKEKPPDRSAEILEVIQVTRGYLVEHPSEAIGGPRMWRSLVEACLRDTRCVVKRVTRGDNSCTYAWAYVPGHPQAPPRNIAWFREGPQGQAMLYQQGWRGCDPPDDPAPARERFVV